MRNMLIIVLITIGNTFGIAEVLSTDDAEVIHVDESTGHRMLDCDWLENGK